MPPLNRLLAIALTISLTHLMFISMAFAKVPDAKMSKVWHASTGRPMTPALQPLPPPAHATKDDIKKDLDDAIADINAIIGTDPNSFAATLISSSGLDLVGDLTDVKNEIDALTDQQFTDLQSKFDKVHGKATKRKHMMSAIVNNPALLAMIHRPWPVTLRLKRASAGAVSILNDPFMQSPGQATVKRQSVHTFNLRVAAFNKGTAGTLSFTFMPEIDATCDPGPGVPNGVSDVYISKGVALDLEIARELLPNDTFAGIPHAVAAGLWGVAAAAELVLEGLHEVYNQCTDQQFQAQTASSLSSLGTQVNNAVTTIDNHTDAALSTAITNINGHTDTVVGAGVVNVNNHADGNLLTITNAITAAQNAVITNANANTLAIITNANVNRDLNTRQLIEADLASTDGSTFVAFFETPASKGGYLETARSIVVLTIAALGTASTTAQANSLLAKGDAYKVAGDYANAYTFYRKAYKTVASHS